MTVSIRPLNDADLTVVARIHIQAFPGSALTHLGYEAVRRYYEWQLHGPHDAERYAVVNGDDIVGFCFCGKFRGALSGFVKKNRFYLIGQILLRPWLLLGDEFRSRVATGLKALVKPSTPSPAVPPTPSFGILAIAVSPAAQGSGAGKVLMNQAERVARERGFTRMNLSVSIRNHQAIAFYERLGWRKVLAGGEWRGEMVKELMA